MWTMILFLKVKPINIKKEKAKKIQLLFNKYQPPIEIETTFL